MNERHLIRGGALLVACVLANGCGNDNGGGNDAKRSSRSLDRPIYPRCTAKGFVKQFARPIAGTGSERAWSLTYSRPTSPIRPLPSNATRTVLIVESSPAKPPAKDLRGAKQVTIGGHRVSYRAPGKKGGAFAAQWKTDRALYTLVADGADNATVRRFIACLP